ncbi:MAG: single-stranded-DNA-specific exonuclease RecJ [Thermacetogeniaceae bacterium]|jgi:single-stranded-DNA-specific exonuclease
MFGSGKEEIARDILELVNDPLVARILWNRGYRTLDAARAFLYPDCYTPADPSALPGLNDAVEVLADSLASGARVCVYGDYDVDGVSATALLVRVLRSLGADVIYHAPNRFTEGYGLNGDVIRDLAAHGCRLLLTCDCGIGSRAEVGLAQDLGMRVIVTDHHDIPEDRVTGCAVVNPKMLDPGHPCRSLPGVGVAYFLAVSLCRRLAHPVDDRLLQLVALGLVADVVPLLGENRYLLQRGLAAINTTAPLAGIAALMKLCGITELNEEGIGFQIAPRLNAPGRVNAPDISVKLLLCDDLQEAELLAQGVDDDNRLRRQLVESVLDSLEGIETDGSLVLFDETWHQGIIGIAAGRLVESFKAPAALMTLKEDGETVVGSARSIEGVDMYGCLSRVAGRLTRFGGHAGAAGFSLRREDLAPFCQALKTELDHALKTTAAIATDRPDVDAEIPFASVDLDSFTKLRLLAPFGEGNPSPRFLTTAARIEACRSIGGGRHQRLVLSKDGASRTALRWWNREAPDAGLPVDVIYTLNRNDYNGTTGIQLVIERMAAAQNREEPEPVLGERQLEIVDVRFAPSNRLPVLPGGDTCLFGEGAPPAARARSTGPGTASGRANRYSIRVCDTLALTSVPAHLSVLREMLAVARCRKLALAYPAGAASAPAPLIRRLMSILKHVAGHGNRTTLEHLASSTGELEIAVILGLRVLRESGYLEWESSGSQIQFSLLNGQQIDPTTENYGRMVKAEAETRAFKDFMSTAKIEAISALFKPDQDAREKT